MQHDKVKSQTQHGKLGNKPQIQAEKSIGLNALKPGAIVRVHQTITERTAKGEDKKRTQVFEGIVIARKHGREPGATITVRKVSSGVGVERIFPINSPWIEKIEVIKHTRVRRAKLYYLRSYTKRIKEKRDEVKLAIDHREGRVNGYTSVTR